MGQEGVTPLQQPGVWDGPGDSKVNLPSGQLKGGANLSLLPRVERCGCVDVTQQVKPCCGRVRPGVYTDRQTGVRP